MKKVGQRGKLPIMRCIHCIAKAKKTKPVLPEAVQPTGQLSVKPLGWRARKAKNAAKAADK